MTATTLHYDKSDQFQTQKLLKKFDIGFFLDDTFGLDGDLEVSLDGIVPRDLSSNSVYSSLFNYPQRRIA